MSTKVKRIVYTLVVITLFTLSYQLNFLEDQENGENRIKNISNYNYPLPEKEESNRYTIAIIGTNDIHGSAFPNDGYDFKNSQEYSFGGLEYMSSEIRAVLKDWKGRALLLDAGDEFQGGLENKLSKGKIITGFLNNLKFESAAFGNHEFDFGIDFLKERVERAVFPYLASNIEDLQGQDITHIFDNTRTTKMFTVGKVKIGVIGLATLETPSSTSTKLDKIMKFTDYKPAIEKHSKELREQGADAVILLSHVGMKCEYPDRYILKVRGKEEIDFSKCTDVEGEMIDLLKSLDPSTIDGVIGGHKHALNHIWVNNIPFISTNNLGRYFNVMYLTFNISNEKKTLLNDEIKIEGPIPVCKQVFDKNNLCELFKENEDQGKLRYYSFHNQVIYKDYTLKPLYDRWWEELKVYKVPFAKTNTFLQKSEKGDFILGNYFTDCLKNTSKADFAILNAGMFRSIWTPGDIDDYKFLNMFPFGNDVVTTKITGADLKTIITTVQGVDGYFAVSGMKNIVVNKKAVDVTFLDDSVVEDNKEYTFVSVAFLFDKKGDAFKLVKDWWKPELTKIGGDTEIMKSCLKETKMLTSSTSMEVTRIVFK